MVFWEYFSQAKPAPLYQSQSWIMGVAIKRKIRMTPNNEEQLFELP